MTGRRIRRDRRRGAVPLFLSRFTHQLSVPRHLRRACCARGLRNQRSALSARWTCRVSSPCSNQFQVTANSAVGSETRTTWSG